MRKVVTIFILSLYLLSSIVAVLAAPSGLVNSNPALFALIKTDTSTNNTVTVQGDRLSFSPGRGVGGKMYGFQPGSAYYYKDLFKIKNITKNDLSVWYTLGDDIQGLYETGVFTLDVSDANNEKWHPGEVIVLSPEGETGGLDFTFRIPVKHEMISYNGYITVHAVQEAPVSQLSTESNHSNQAIVDENGEQNTSFEEIVPGDALTGNESGEDKSFEPSGVELAMAPEGPQTALLSDDLVFNLSNWPYLMLIPLPILAWLLMSRRVLVLVPGEEGRYKVVARKIARRRDKKWFVNIEKELDKHLPEYGQVIVDFRGGMLRKADKSVYAGEFLLGASDLRYALVSSRRFTTWTATLKKKRILAVG